MRGDVLRLKSTRTTGQQQAAERYGIVVQGDQFCALSTLIVCPTSTSALASSFRPQVNWDGTSTLVLVDQMTTIDYTRVIEHVGLLITHEMQGIDRAIARFLGLS